jgi:hypothetical protein
VAVTDGTTSKCRAEQETARKKVERRRRKVQLVEKNVEQEEI